MSQGFRTRIALAATAMGVVLSSPALAQDSSTRQGASSPADIIVTARRVEERLQDVPISITVFDETQLQQRNIVVPSDLAIYTPSLSVNARYGPEKAAFSLRGFNQDQSTAPTVGVYFADVIGVRAQGGTTSGNSVGAGSFTDLQNVQVLKGPQGTLFGRNTTGGAILLVPTRPSDSLEGYVEGTLGNHDQRRVQAAVNVPLADTFKVRLAADRNVRDGYMRNRSGVGPKDYNDINYTYLRMSVLAELTPDLENLTIAHYSRSNTNGYAARYIGCDRAYAATASPLNPPTTPGGRPSPNTRLATAAAACNQLDRQEARGDSLLDVEVSNPDPSIILDTWQVINTTTWNASDTITLKNIVSYGEFYEDSSFNLYSDNFFVPSQFTGVLPSVGQRFGYIQLDKQPGYHAASQSTMTEELQLQGRSSDGKLNYVVGGYLEFSRPRGWNQQRTSIYGNCSDPGTLTCTTPLGFGVISESRTRLSFDNHGIFAQGTYNFTDQIGLTLGGRWTFDKIDGYSESNRYTLATVAPGVTIPIQRVCNDNLNHPTVNLLTNGGNLKACGTNIVNKSDKPTWLVGLDYKPTTDTLLYAKYSRGYRQGGVNFTNPGLETWKPEKVDAYELGAKLTFRGSVPGYFNVAAFYNDFSDQQVFGALVAKPESGLAGGAAIINAGKSEIKGIEADAGVTLFDNLYLTVGYAYLDTKLKELVTPVLAPDSPFAQIIPRGRPGDPLTYSPKNRLTASGEYRLPLANDLGDLSFGVIYTYTSSQFVDGNNKIPSIKLLDLNAGWRNISGSGVDLLGFATNITDEHYFVTSGGGFASSGIEDRLLGQPRMYGVRLRWNFGN